MADPLFGSVSQWPAIQFPTFGYLQTPIPPGTRPLGLVPPAVSGQGGPSPTDPYTFGSGGPISGVPSFGPGWSAILSNPIGSGMPAFTGPEIAIGVTAPAVLNAVAMRRGQPLGPTSDQEIEDFIYDAFDLLPGASEVEVRCEAGRATLTGSVPHKRVKRDVGEIAWAIPTLNDVVNNVTIATRRRTRTSHREGETTAVAGVRKPA